MEGARRAYPYESIRWPSPSSLDDDRKGLTRIVTSTLKDMFGEGLTDALVSKIEVAHGCSLELLLKDNPKAFERSLFELFGEGATILLARISINIDKVYDSDKLSRDVLWEHLRSDGVDVSAIKGWNISSDDLSDLTERIKKLLMRSSMH
jgi:hypothetical protein